MFALRRFAPSARPITLLAVLLLAAAPASAAGRPDPVLRAEIQRAALRACRASARLRPSDFDGLVRISTCSEATARRVLKTLATWPTSRLALVSLRADTK